jgi:hypothetical protein
MTASGKTSPVVVVLLGGILVALVVLIALMARSGRTSPVPPPDQGLNPSSPSKALDAGRITSTYVPGRTYRTVVKVTFTSRGSNKDWGIVRNMNIHYIGVMETLRTVETNDGTTMTLLLNFRQSQNLAMFTTVEGVVFDLGIPGTLAVAGLDWLGTTRGLPPGWTAITMKTADGIVNSPLVKLIMNKLANDTAAKAFVFVSGLQGKKVRVKYVNGKGVTDIIPIDTQLTDDERSLIKGTSMASDAYILPDLECKPGSKWSIHGQDMLPLLDPSLRATMLGEINVIRKSDREEAANPVAVIEIDRGTLELRNCDKMSKTVGKWEPRGQIEFSFKDKIVTSANLTGAMYYEKKSTDHIIFESRMTVQPQYNITYFCEILDKP